MDEKWEKHADKSLDKLVSDIIKSVELPERTGDASSRPDLKALKEAGSELWLDTGDHDAAEKNWRAELSGLTTNNTLANQVVQKGIYDSVISKAADELKSNASSLKKEDLVVEVGFVVNAIISSSLVSRFEAHVSVELHPSVANDVDATVMFGKRYFAIDPENFYVKVPLTPAGVIAVRKLTEEGVKVNFTLGFSARQNHLISRISRPTFLNVFLGRDNQVVIENKIGDGKNIGERATLASQNDILSARADGITDTRQIAASLREGEQVKTLAGVDVLTIPPGVIEKFYGLNYDPESLAPRLDADLPVETTEPGMEVLWEISDKFRAMTEALAKEDISSMTPARMVDFINDNGVDNLFGKYDAADINTIRAKGKIPDLSQWAGRGMAVDDLLTSSALEAFAKDQEELDARIAGFVKK